MVHNPGSQRLNIGHLGYDDRIVALVALARGLWLTGRPDRAIEAARYTVREAEQLEQPLTLGISLIWTIYVFLWVGDWANAESLIERLIDHSARHFLGPYHAVGIGQKGRTPAPPRRRRRRHRASSPQPGHAVRDPAPDHDDGVCDGAGGGAGGAEPAGRGFAHDRRSHRPDRRSRQILRHAGNAPGQGGHPGPIRPRRRRPKAVFSNRSTLSRRQCALGWELRGAMSLAASGSEAGRKRRAQALLAPLVARYQEGLVEPRPGRRQGAPERAELRASSTRYRPMALSQLLTTSNTPSRPRPAMVVALHGGCGETWHFLTMRSTPAGAWPAGIA